MYCQDIRPHLIHMESFLPNMPLTIYTKYLLSGILCAWEMGFYASERERHQLLLECLINFLMCIRMIGRASYSIYNPVIANIVLLLPITTLKFHVKYQPLGTPL